MDRVTMLETFDLLRHEIENIIYDCTYKEGAFSEGFNEVPSFHYADRLMKKLARKELLK